MVEAIIGGIISLALLVAALPALIGAAKEWKRRLLGELGWKGSEVLMLESKVESLERQNALLSQAVLDLESDAPTRTRVNVVRRWFPYAH